MSKWDHFFEPSYVFVPHAPLQVTRMIMGQHPFLNKLVRVDMTGQSVDSHRATMILERGLTNDVTLDFWMVRGATMVGPTTEDRKHPAYVRVEVWEETSESTMGHGRRTGYRRAYVEGIVWKNVVDGAQAATVMPVIFDITPDFSGIPPVGSFADFEGVRFVVPVASGRASTEPHQNEAVSAIKFAATRKGGGVGTIMCLVEADMMFPLPVISERTIPQNVMIPTFVPFTVIAIKEHNAKLREQFELYKRCSVIILTHDGRIIEV